MRIPKRLIRRSPRPRGFDDDDGTPITELLRAVPDDRTGLRGQRQETAALAPVRDPFLAAMYRPPVSAPPQPSFTPMPVTAVAVTIGDGVPPSDEAMARRTAALTYIRLKVAILEGLDHADRIDAAEQARRRGDPLAPRSDVRQLITEATSLLRGAR